MKKKLIFFIIAIIPSVGVTQDFRDGVFNSLDSALKNPELALTLRLDSDDLLEISPGIVRLINVRSISLSGNHRINLVDLFDKLSLLPKLESLNLSDCQIESLPPNISKLSRLKRLMLGNNKLTELPPEIKHLLKLKELIFSQYPDDFRRLTEDQKLRMLSLLPHTKILLTEYGEGVHGHYRLEAETVRVTRTNLWRNK
jgi:Leucine-rich repeat (LRR) protein